MSLAATLDGGSPRSSEVTTVQGAVQLVLTDPTLFDELVSEILNDDYRIARRAAKAVEKVTRKNAAWLQPWKSIVLEQMTNSDNQHIRWQAALLFGRLQLDQHERDYVIEVLFNWLDCEGSVIRTCALQGLADQAQKDPTLLPDVLPLLEESLAIGTPAMRARSRHLLKKLQQHT